MDKVDILTNIGVVIAGIFGGLIAYYGKKPSPPSRSSTDAVVAGVGLEFGNRLQMDMQLAELKRIADAVTIIADRKQASTEAKLDRILQDLEEAEEREREQQREVLPQRPKRLPRNRPPR